MGACHICGEPVGFGKTRVTAHAYDVGAGVMVLGLINERTTRKDQGNIERLLREGEDMRYVLHEYAHGRGGMVPSRSELTSWQQTVNMMAQWFSQAAPQEWSTFIAGIQSPETRRLVLSMLVGRTP